MDDDLPAAAQLGARAFELDVHGGEGAAAIVGDDDRVAARAPAVTDEARVIVPEPRAMMAPLGRAAPIIGFEPPLLGLGVASGFERLPRVGERAMPAGRAPSVEAPKNAEAKPASLAGSTAPNRKSPPSPTVVACTSRFRLSARLAEPPVLVRNSLSASRSYSICSASVRQGTDSSIRRKSN